MKKISIIILLMVIWCSFLFSADDGFEIDLFKLQKDITAEDDLFFKDSLAYYNDSLFTGTSFLYFESSQLQQVKHFKLGKLNGPSYAWYEDGANAMQANYNDGYLVGRFVAWSEYGSVIYDIFFDKNQFRFDLQLNRDDTRETTRDEGAESDGDSKEGSGE